MTSAEVPQQSNMKYFLVPLLLVCLSVSAFSQTQAHQKQLLSSCEEMRPLENFSDVRTGILKYDLEETEVMYGVPVPAGTIYYPVYKKRGTQRLFFFVRHETPDYFSIKEILSYP